MAGKSTIALGFYIEDGGNGLKKLVMEADALKKIMSETVKVSNELQSKWIDVAAFATGINAAKDALNQLSSTINSIAGESIEFNKAMRSANTMAGKNAEGFAELKGEVAELAKTVPVARDQLANGLYQVISNGVPEDNWIDFLNVSARSAVGGIADINKVVGVTSTLIKNYGLQWSSAQEIQDKIQLTAKNGVTSFEQLAQALPRVAGNASTLGVSIDELMATFATLTGVSGNTAEVSTQLGAIFTALVKPSTEAGKMATQMGIQFDAAAIKAAGGFQNFLKQLDASVKAYASASGQLEQEIYGRLFGSAESLRALIPLQGELADKFTANIGAMKDSAGTMDQAFVEMASTGESSLQMMKNRFAELIDGIAPAVEKMNTFISTIALASTAGSNIMVLVKTLKQLVSVQTLVSVKGKVVAGVLAMTGFQGHSLSRAVEFMSKSFKSATVSATALKFAVKGLLISTGVGIAIAALTSIIGYFISKADEASDSADELGEKISGLANAQNECDRVMAQTTASLDLEATKLRVLMNANIDTANAVAELNKKYGESFGIHQTAAEWLDILKNKTKDYALMLGYQRKMQALADAAAEANIKKQKTAEEKTNWEKVNKNKMRAGQKDKVGLLTEVYSNDEDWKRLKDNLEGYRKELSDIEKEQEIVVEMMEELRKSSGLKLPSETTVTPVVVPTVTPTDKDKKFKETSKEAVYESKAYYKQLKQDLEKQLSNINIELDPIAYQNLVAQIEDVKSTLAGLDGYRARIAIELKHPDIEPMTSAQANESAKPGLLSGVTLLTTKDIVPPDLPDAYEENQKKLEEFRKSMDKTRETAAAMGQGVGAVGSIFGSLSSVVGDCAGAFLEWAGNLLNAVSQAIPAIAQLVIQQKAQANANMEVATTGAAASVASIPVVGWLMAGAAVASVIAAMAGIPKFADGGIAYGPTFGLFGEYAGASNNPEVVAPLDKLRGMLQPSSGGVGGKVTFKIDGRTLVGILEKENNIKHRS